MAEELFVEDPVRVFGADVDVYERGGEESVEWVVSVWKGKGMGFGGICTH